MRIISQDGIYNLPYDKCIVWINNKKVIEVSPIGEPDSNYTFASYSTPEKAEKAMNLLNEAYIVHENFKKMDSELQLKMLGAVENKIGLKYGGVFQFSKEEDL